MFSKIDDFLGVLYNEHKSTIKVFEMVDESKKSVKINDNLRSLERMAWHITQTMTEMPARTGILSEDFLENKPVPGTFQEIIATYKKYGKLLADSVKSGWTDADLRKEVDMYGEMWPNGKTVFALIAHEIHHRAEMIAVMRMLEMKVPGLYGPSKEEWAAYGMPAME